MPQDDPLRAAVARYFLRGIGILLAMAILLMAFRWSVLDWSTVPSRSMTPTIQPGETLIVNKLAFGLTIPFTHLTLTTWTEPRDGQVIVFRSPIDGRMLTKRVIAAPGDRFDDQGSIKTVPQRMYYVLGDNRQNSIDSRTFGLISRDRIVGRVLGLPSPDHSAFVLHTH